MLLVLLNWSSRRRPGTSKTFVENEPFWLNPEAFRAARVLLKEVSSCYLQEDLESYELGTCLGYITHHRLTSRELFKKGFH